MQLTYFLNSLMFNLLFYCHIILYWEKVNSLRNLARILPLKSKLSGKFQRFNAIDGSIKLLKNSWNHKNFHKMKNCNTFYEVQKTSRLNEIIQSSPTHFPSDKILLRLFLRRYTEINGHLLSKCFKNAVLGVKKRWSANVFSDTKQKHVCWEILVNSERFWLYCKTILFSMWVEVRKMSEVFWAKLYCKISDLFR